MPLRGAKNNQRQPAQRPRQRTPIAYYRGRPPDEDAKSPFERKSAAKPKLRGYAYGVLDIAVIALLIAGLVYSLMIRPDPVLKADDYTYRSLADYQNAAAEQLGKLNNRNKITFSQSGLETALKKKFSEIRTVTVELPLFSERPTINLSIDRPSFFLDSQGTRYVVDQAGRAVVKAANLPAVKNLPVINDDSGFSVSPGRQVLSSTGVGFINTVLKQCRQAGVAVESITLPPIPQEMDLKAKGQGYFVKFYLGGDAQIQVGQYLAARHHFDSSQPSQYLDVRVAGKVFYK